MRVGVVRTVDFRVQSSDFGRQTADFDFSVLYPLTSDVFSQTSVLER